MTPVGGISSAWAVRSATASDGTVFRRPSEDPRNQSESGDGTRRALAGEASDGPVAAKGASRTATEKLTPPQLREVEELAQRDRDVRAHEAAHQASAGGLGGAASFTYEVGPDGRSYAIGGEVPIDMSPGRTPEETIRRAAQIRAAALAPADPSSQDMAVAAQAAVMAATAEQQLTQEKLAALGGARARSTAPARSSEPGPDIRLPGQEPTSNQRVTAAAASAEAESVPDVTDQVAATAAALYAHRSSSGPSAALLEQIGRLATMAYRGGSTF